MGRGNSTIEIAPAAVSRVSMAVAVRPLFEEDLRGDTVRSQFFRACCEIGHFPRFTDYVALVKGDYSYFPASADVKHAYGVTTWDDIDTILGSNVHYVGKFAEFVQHGLVDGEHELHESIGKKLQSEFKLRSMGRMVGPQPTRKLWLDGEIILEIGGIKDPANCGKAFIERVFGEDELAIDVALEYGMVRETRYGHNGYRSYSRYGSEMDMIRDLRSAFHYFGERTLTRREYDEYQSEFGSAYASDIVRWAGTWSNAISKAGVKISRKHVSSSPGNHFFLVDPLNDVRAAWESGNRAYLTQTAYKDHIRNDEYAITVWQLIARWDSWENVLTSAGVSPVNPPHDIYGGFFHGRKDDPDVAKADLVAAVAMRGPENKLTYDSYCDLFKTGKLNYGADKIVSALGAESWADALNVAGLKLAKKGRYTDQDYIDLVKEVSDHIGGSIPKVADYKKYRAEVRPEIPTHINLRKRLGQWNEVLVKAGFDIA